MTCSRIQELETALKEEYESESFRRNDENGEYEFENFHQDDETGDNITEIARPNIWQTCLDVNTIESKMDLFDDIFDLPEQKVLREDCQNFVC